MFKKTIPIILTFTILISSFSFSTQVQAKKEFKINQKLQKFDKILQNLKDKDPQKPISQKLKTVKNNENELISNQNDNLQIKFELQNKKINLKNKLKGDISVGIPNSEQMDSVDLVENKVVYSGQNSKVDVIVESVEGGFRQIINIKDSSAPDFYDFPVELETGEKLELTKNGGAVIIGKNPKNVDFKVENLPKELDNKAIEIIKSDQIVKTIIFSIFIYFRSIFFDLLALKN